jgi:uncharacterized protein YnzC (UPF0291/DUF896 family)
MLQILGIILLFIIGKFVYDTFLTNNTTETKEWYKEHYPEENYRLDRNEGLDFNVKPKVYINDRENSLVMAAKELNTTPALVRETYIKMVKTGVNSQDEKITFLNSIRNNKISEAQARRIDPDDTVFALMEGWAKEYLNSVDFKEKEKLNHANKTFLDSYPELKKIVDSGNKIKLTNYLRNNPEYLSIYLNHISDSSKPNSELLDNDLPF